MFIYKLTNKINGKIYIGLETGEEGSQWKRHQAHRNCGKQVIHKALGKYGVENFTHETIDTASSIGELVLKEVHWIAHYDSFKTGYNSSTGGELAMTLDESLNLSDEDLIKLKEARSALTSELNRIRWENSTEEERKEFIARTIHSPEANKKRKRTIKQQWDKMSDEERTARSKSMKQGWANLPKDEIRTKNERSNGLFTAKVYEVTHPDGHIEVINGLTDFCTTHDMVPQNLRYYVDKDRDYKGFHVRTINQPDIDESYTHKKSKYYEVTHPDGHIEVIHGLTKFCKDHDMIPYVVRYYVDKDKTYNGYKLRTITTNDQ